MTGAELRQPVPGRILSGALGCFAGPRMYLPVRTGAPRLDHPAVEGIRSDLAPQFGLGDQLCLQSQAGAVAGYERITDIADLPVLLGLPRR